MQITNEIAEFLEICSDTERTEDEQQRARHSILKYLLARGVEYGSKRYELLTAMLDSGEYIRDTVTAFVAPIEERRVSQVLSVEQVEQLWDIVYYSNLKQQYIKELEKAFKTPNCSGVMKAEDRSLIPSVYEMMDMVLQCENFLVSTVKSVELALKKNPIEQATLKLLTGVAKGDSSAIPKLLEASNENAKAFKVSKMSFEDAVPDPKKQQRQKRAKPTGSGKPTGSSKSSSSGQQANAKRSMISKASDLLTDSD